MESLLLFIRDIYVSKLDNRITVKEIYEDFRAWIIIKYGISTWNNIGQRQVYASLKTLPDYPYIRFKEGYCLKGISYRNKIPTSHILTDETCTDVTPKSPIPSSHVNHTQTVVNTSPPDQDIPQISYLTLNIIPKVVNNPYKLICIREQNSLPTLQNTETARLLLIKHINIDCVHNLINTIPNHEILKENIIETGIDGGVENCSKIVEPVVQKFKPFVPRISQMTLPSINNKAKK